jgi:hypothetical protein
MSPALALLLRRAVGPALRLLFLLLVAVVGGWIGVHAVRSFMGPPVPGPAAVASRLHEIQELATARVVVRTIQRGAAREDGVLLANTDEILCRLLVSADYGFDLARIGPERVRVGPGRIAITLPAPQLLAPGFTVAPAELLDQRTTRWLSDAGPGQLAAVQAARSNALAEAPRRITELGIDRQVRDTTRAALKHLLPTLLGDPRLRVTVDFDDEAEAAPPAPGGAG